MTGADDIDHVEIVFFDQPVQVHINEVQPSGGALMPEQSRLDLFELERGFEEGIVLQIDLPNREVICGAPIRVHFFQQVRGQRGDWHFLSRKAKDVLRNSAAAR
jgi:hypothetical protein